MIRIGTRGSPLARAQAQRVLSGLEERVPGVECRLEIVKTQGDKDTFSPLDRPAGAGVFTSALTQALLEDRIDLAVHSLKDLPLMDTPGTCLAAILERDDPADLMWIREEAWDPVGPLDLMPGSRVGSSAPRRQSQLRQEQSDLVPLDVRGNVGTRLGLLEAGILDALLMAAAVQERMELKLPPGIRRRRLDPERFPPAPGQGTIAVQARVGSSEAGVAERLDDEVTRAAVEAERRVLGILGGGCGLPLGVYVHKPSSGGWRIHATYGVQKDRLVRVERAGPDLHVLQEQTASGLINRSEKRFEEVMNEGEQEAIDGPVLVVTLDQSAARRYAQVLAPSGWQVLPWSLIETRATGEDTPSLAQGPLWIAVTSARAAHFAAQAAFQDDGSWRPVRLAAGGPATAKALREAGLPVHAVARDHSGRGLAREIARFPGEPLPVLWPAAREPAGGFSAEAESLGLSVVHWPVYEVVPRQDIPELIVDQADALLVTSPSNVHALRLHGVGPERAQKWFAIGETTARALQDAGYPMTAVAGSASPTGVKRLLQDVRKKLVGQEVD